MTEETDIEQDSPEQEKDSLGDDLRAAYEEAEKTSEAPAQADSEVSKETVSTEEATKQAAKSRTRDESGKFAKSKEEGETEASLQAPISSGAQPSTQLQPETTTPFASPLPWNWSKEAKDSFSKLPKEFQDVALSRAKEIEEFGLKQKQELDRWFQYHHDIEHVIAPLRDEWAQRGVLPAQAIAHYASFDKLLLRDPTSALRQLARDNDVDLQALVNSPEIQQENAVPAEIRNSLDELQSWKNQFIQSQQIQLQTSAEREVESFSKEADQSGKSLRPYFQQVHAQMLPIVTFLRQADPYKPHRTILQEAYEQAVWTNPEVRAALLKEEEAKRTEVEKGKVAAAKKAATSINGAPGPGLQKSTPNDIRGMLEAAWDTLQ